jgi:hypothetical protein
MVQAQSCPRIACDCNTAWSAANQNLLAASAFRAAASDRTQAFESRIVFDLTDDCSGIVDVCELNRHCIAYCEDAFPRPVQLGDKAFCSRVAVSLGTEH